MIKSEPKNQPMQYGFIDFNLNVWPDASVNTYNRFNEQVAKRDKLPANDKSSLAYKELEFYKNQRHKTFVQLMEIAAEPRIKLIPSYKTIARLKRLYRKHQLPDSQLNELLRKVFRERGGQWFSSSLSWYR